MKESQAHTYFPLFSFPPCGFSEGPKITSFKNSVWLFSPCFLKLKEKIINLGKQRQGEKNKKNPATTTTFDSSWFTFLVSPSPSFRLILFLDIFLRGKGRENSQNRQGISLGITPAWRGKMPLFASFLCGSQGLPFFFYFFTLHVGKPRHNLSVLTFSSPQIRASEK